MKYCRVQNRNTFLFSSRFIYRGLPESGDKGMEASTEKQPDDSKETDQKYREAVAKLTDTLSTYENSDDPFIKTEVKKAKEDLKKVEDAPALSEAEKERVMEQVNSRIIFFSSRDIENSKNYLIKEGDFVSADLYRQLEHVVPLVEGDTAVILGKLHELFENEKNEEVRGRYDSLIGKIQKVDNLQKTSLSTLDFLKNPDDANKRALVLANFKDQIGAITEERLPDRQYVTEMEDLMGEYADATAGSLEDVEMTGTYEKDPQVATAVEKTSFLSGDADFRLDGIGVYLTTLTGNQGVKVKLLSADSYMGVIDANGNKLAYVKVQVNPPDGPIGYIPKKNFDFQALATKPVAKAPEKTEDTYPSGNTDDSENNIENSILEEILKEDPSPIVKAAIEVHRMGEKLRAAMDKAAPAAQAELNRRYLGPDGTMGYHEVEYGELMNQDLGVKTANAEHREALEELEDLAKESKRNSTDIMTEIRLKISAAKEKRFTDEHSGGLDK